MNQPIIAYRIWKVSPEGRLSTAYRGSGKWPWMKPYSSACEGGNYRTYLSVPVTVSGLNDPSPSGRRSRVADHDAPHFDCACGLYGFKSVKSLEQTFAQFYKGNCVLGRVALWGRIVEHRDGYRAEYGYPQVLYYPDSELMDSKNWAHGLAGKDMLSPVRVAAQKYGIDSSPLPNDVCSSYLAWAHKKRMEEEEARQIKEQQEKLYFTQMSDFATAWHQKNEKLLSGKVFDTLYTIDERKKANSPKFKLSDFWKGF